MLDSVLEEAADVCERRARPAQSDRRQGRLHVEGRRGHDARASRRRIRSSPTRAGSDCRFRAEYGGQGLPQMLLGPTLEMWNAANIGFANGPLLNQGAIEAIELVGSRRAEAALHSQSRFAASGRARCASPNRKPARISRKCARSAVPEGDHYRISGTEDLHHLRRARHGREHHSPRARASARRAGRHQGHLAVHRAEVSRQCRRHARRAQRRRLRGHRAQARHQRAIRPARSTTARRATARSAISSAKPNRGLEYMFIMMNAARFSVGVQGIALADRAYQSALEYAKERVQGRDLKPRLAQRRSRSSSIPTCGAC